MLAGSSLSFEKCATDSPEQGPNKYDDTDTPEYDACYPKPDWTFPERSNGESSRSAGDERKLDLWSMHEIETTVEIRGDESVRFAEYHVEDEPEETEHYLSLTRHVEQYPNLPADEEKNTGENVSPGPAGDCCRHLYVRVEATAGELKSVWIWIRLTRELP